MTLLIVAVCVLGAIGLALAAALLTTTRRLRSTRRRVEELERGLVEVEPRGTIAGLAGRATKAVRAVTTTATRLREDGVGSVLAESLDVLERWAREDRATIVRVAAPDGTATVVFTDIEDSTPHNEALGDERWLTVLAAHERIVRGAVERHRGHVVKNQGDGFMIVFGRPDAALDAAVAIQRELDASRHRALKRTPLKVRIGMHAGPVLSRDGDFYGRTVAVAARVAGLADGGEILLTEDVEAPGRDLTDRGRHHLKGVTEPVRVLSLYWRADS